MQPTKSDAADKPGQAQARQTFAAYVRAQVQAILQRQEAGYRAVSAADRECLEATNHYLVSEQETPLDIEAMTQVPADLHRQLADTFESRALTHHGIPYYDGPQAQERAASRNRNQAFADWSAALWRYYAQQENIETTAPERLRLWKQEWNRAQDGTMQPHIIEVDHIDHADHAIVGFNGVTGMHSAQASLRGFFDQMTQVLGGDLATLTPHHGKKLTLYVVTYPDAHRIRYAQEIPAFNANPEQYVSAKVRSFTHDVVLPWLGLHEGQPHLKPADLKAHLRRMNLFLFSYGACIGKEIRNALADWLQEQGYERAVIRQAFAEVYAVSIHPVSRLDESPACGQFSSLYVVSRSDMRCRARAAHERLVPPETQAPALIPLSENELLVWLDHPSKDILWADPNVAEQFSKSAHATGQGKDVDRLAALGSGHSLRMVTQPYHFIGKDGHMEHYSPGYLANSLRSVVAAVVMPKDISQTLDADFPAPEGVRPIPTSFRLKEAIRRYQVETQEKQRE